MPRRGENIRKRKDGRWEGRYIKNYDPKTHKAKYASIYGKSYKEVKRKMDEARYKTEINQLYIESKSKRFGEVVESWLSSKKPFLKPSSIIKYSNLIELHILPHLGHLYLKDINANILCSYLEHEKSSGNTLCDESLSISTLHTVCYILNSAIRYAAEHNMMSAFTVQIPSSPPEKTQIKTLSQHDESLLEKYLADHISIRNLGIMLSLYCGLRIGEVCGLRWGDINVPDKTLKVSRTVQRIPTGLETKKTSISVGPPKSLSSIRTIPIPSFLLHIITQLYKGEASDCYLLSGASEKPIEPRTFEYYFNRVLEQAGVGRINYHALRHTFATNCVAMGFDMKTLSEILGHSNVNITLNKYIHPTMQQKKDQMDYWSIVKGQIYGQNL